MNPEYFESPVPHLIIRNYYTETELKTVWKEIDFLTSRNKLHPPDLTLSAQNNGKHLKKNSGIFLDDVYINREISDILSFNKKIWDDSLINYIVPKHFIFEYLKHCNRDTTLLSYYNNNDYYMPHKDFSLFTCITNLYKEPLKFSGGDFILGDCENKKTIKLENNRMIIFPGMTIHEVTPVTFQEPLEDFSGIGRYTISNFLSLNI